MEERILTEIKHLGIKEFEKLNSLNLLDGNYLNLEIELPNGDRAKLLDDRKNIMQIRLTSKTAINVMALQQMKVL